MGFFSTLSGKSVESKVQEYSEVYGEVLLGLHRDLETQRRLQHGFDQRLDDQTGLLAACRGELEAHANRIDSCRRVMDDQQQRLEDHARLLAGYRDDLDNCRRVMDDQQQRLEDHARLLAEYRDDLDSSRRVMDDQQQRLEDQGRDLSAVRETLAARSHEVSALAAGSRGLHSRLEQLQAGTRAEMDSIRATVEELRAACSARAGGEGESPNGEAADLGSPAGARRSADPEAATAVLAALAGQIRQLRLACVLAYLFALAMGVAPWILR